MDVLLEIGNPTQMIAELTVEPVGRQVGYMFNYKSNIDWLKNEFDGLRVDRNGMQQKVDQARRNVEEILDPVECWMREANRLNEEADNFLRDEEGHAKAKCSFRFFPNLVLRHQLSKKAYKMATSIAKLRVDGPKDPISCSQVVPSSDEVIEGYEAFESRNSMMNQIMDALRNPEVHVVGLHGMGGIGKTMLAKEVSRLARLDELFEIDVMVSVSQDPKPKDIQQHIAEKLGLKLDEETVSVRANKLRHRLRQEKKILITLDDVWDKLDLQEIGVSFGNDQKGCKILLTSRSAGVCDIMKAEKSTTFNLQVLTPSEATKLLNQNVGELAVSPNFKILANEIIKECAGLPIAIVIVASTLKNEEQEVWRDVLRELRTSSPTNIEGMDTKVYSSVRLSYNHLPNEEAKNLLLLCSLHAEDENILIEDLMKYGMGLSWFHNITTLKDARNSVYHLVVKLKERSLLLDGEEEGWVKLHDVIRDACLSFASKDKCMHFIRDIAHFKEFIENEKLVKEATGISLPYEAINHLPQKLKWPHLKLLWLRGEEFELEILDEQCLEEMKDLRVLYLSDIQVKETCFFSSLQKLQTLCLRSCDLGDVAPIGELNKLKILDLSKSNFLKLPKEIGQLTQLQLLDLNFCSTLLHVEPGMLLNLKNLEQLHMKSNFGEWGAEGNASLVELNDLDKLTTVCVTVSNINNVPKFWLSNKMDSEKYEISIGDRGVFASFHCENVEEVISTKKEEENLISFNKPETLQLSNLRYLRRFNATVNFPSLSKLTLVDCFKLTTFVPGSTKAPQRETFFDGEVRMPNLRELELKKIGCKQIWHHQPSPIFNNLETLKVYRCHNLKSLMPYSLVTNLKCLWVCNCENMEEVISTEKEEENLISFNKLETLQLFHLRSLQRFNTAGAVNFPSLSEMIVENCFKLTTFVSGSTKAPQRETFFGGVVHMSNLSQLQLKEVGCKQIWHHQPSPIFNNLVSLDVHDCHDLKSLMSNSIATNLESLLTLVISNCENMEEVISTEKGEENLISFNKLNTLSLYKLRSLRRFNAVGAVNFPSLSKMTLVDCCKLTTFVPGSTKAPPRETLFGGEVSFFFFC